MVDVGAKPATEREAVARAVVDLGDDLVAYGRQKAQLVSQLLPGLVDRMTKEGEDYTQARRAFNVLLAKEAEALYFAARYVGGLHSSRSHKGDKDAQPPMAVVDPKKQREALAFLEKEAFGVSSFQFPPELLNRLDELIVFRQLDREDVRNILEIELTKVRGRLAAKKITLKLEAVFRDIGHAPADVTE